jgi:hypothetical protein
MGEMGGCDWGSNLQGPVRIRAEPPPSWEDPFLADPAANAPQSGTFRMPNLGLKPGEIGFLVAFVNAERGGGN